MSAASLSTPILIWLRVFATTMVLLCAQASRCHSTITPDTELFPVPWPDDTLTRAFGSLIASSNWT